MIDTTCYVTAPHGSVWHPDAWALLPFVLRTMRQAHDNQELKVYVEQLDAVMNSLLDSVRESDLIDVHMDVMQVSVDMGLRQQWELNDYRRKKRDEERKEFWQNMIDEGRIDEYKAYLLTNQIIKGKAVSTCKHCGVDYWREFVQPAAGDATPGMPMIYWVNNVPGDWEKQGPGHFQYDSICGGICWDCGIDGPPAGPPKPVSAERSVEK